MKKWIGFAAGSLFSVVTILSLSGCSSGNKPHGQPATGPVTIAGIVHGGQQPVSGAVIQLYAVGGSGYGSTPTGLISAGNQAISGIGCSTILPGIGCGTLSCQGRQRQLPPQPPPQLGTMSPTEPRS